MTTYMAVSYQTEIYIQELVFPKSGNRILFVSKSLYILRWKNWHCIDQGFLLSINTQDDAAHSPLLDIKVKILNFSKKRQTRVKAHSGQDVGVRKDKFCMTYGGFLCEIIKRVLSKEGKS